MEEQVWTYVIGDIHGCYNELLKLEKKIRHHALEHGVRPMIISVGDLVDRGPKSCEVVEHFRKGFEQGTHAAVMGNHELLMLETIEAFSPENFQQEGCNYPDWFVTYKINFEKNLGFSKYLLWNDYMVTTRSMWMGQGGYNTLISYGCDPHDASTWKLPAKDLSFLINLPVYWENNNFIITHALALATDLQQVKGFISLLKNNNGKLNEEQTEQLRKSVSSLVWNRSTENLEAHENKGHISGHTPLKKVRRFKRLSCVQIDTGCVYGGRLTSICLESNHLFSVKAERNYLNN